MLPNVFPGAGDLPEYNTVDAALWYVEAWRAYVEATGDESLLDERTPYLEAEQPFEPLPAGKHGMGFVPLRSFLSDELFELPRPPLRC